MGRTWSGNDPKDFGTDHAQQPVGRPMSDAEYSRITGRGSKKKKHSILKWLNEPKNKKKR